MKRILLLTAVFAIIAGLGAPRAHATNDDGYSHGFKWFRDDDGDGIPNGRDDDWTRPGDGTGFRLKHGFGIVLPGMFVSTAEEGIYHRKQKRFRYDRTETPGDCTMEHKRLRIGGK